MTHQWGTPAKGQAKDSSLAQAVGTLYEATSPAARVTAEAEIAPLKMVWFNSATRAESYAKANYPLAYANWQYSTNHSTIQQFMHNAGVSKLFSFNLGPLGEISDPAMWRSLGWLILGFLLMILGIYLWLRNSGIAPMVVPVPV